MFLNTTRIEILLAEQCRTKTQLGIICGIPGSRISTILKHGTCQPRTVGKLAKGLGVAVEEIIIFKNGRV